MAQDPYRYFRLEARDLLDQFAKGVLELERTGASAPVVQQLFRLAHTLKGAARVVKHRDIANRAHALEDTLSPLRETGVSVTRVQIDKFLKEIDDIGAQLAALTLEKTQGTAAKPRAEEPLRTVRADIAEMDALLDGVSETHALLNRLRAVAQDLEHAEHLSGALQAQLAPLNTIPSRGLGDRPFQMADELWKRFGSLDRNLDSAIDQMDRELRQLRDAAEQLRFVPAGNLFTSFERLARDTAQALSKHVIFEGVGGAIRLDSHVIDTIRGALMQIVRNAVAHGIESKDERFSSGKDPAGRITLEIFRRGHQIVFQCRDDGRGIDIDAIRAIAGKRGLLEQDGKPPSREEIIRLLMRGGISTSHDVTEESGRGVGLDVVQDAVTQLGGHVTVQTDLGKGTTFQLFVPRSLASMEALIVEASGIVALIPLDAVRLSMRVAADDLTRSAGGSSVLYEQTAIPFFPLSRMIGDVRSLPDRSWTMVVIASSGRCVAIGVDRIVEAARVVVHPIPDHTPASAIVGGAALDAEGNPQLVLDAEGLVAEAERGRLREADATGNAHSILVVDDSLTTRMLEQSILESAGYTVSLAISGEEALGLLRRERYALVLTDVEMPGMDGFTLIEHMRTSVTTRDTPAILVTSLNSPEFRQRGVDVGAQGYIVKSEFDQAKLLAMIRSHTG